MISSFLESVKNCVTGGTKVNEDEYKKFMEEPQLKPKVTKSLDLCFVIDATGSMSSYIDLVKRSLMQIITLINEISDEDQVRMGVVIYRDYGDGDKSIEVTDLVVVNDDNLKKNKVIDHLQKVKCFGGSDTPEDVRGGLTRAVTDLSWKGDHRFVILVADAPCHGKQYHNDSDDHPNEVIDRCLWLLMKEDITLLGLEFLDQTKIMYDEFAKIFGSKGFSQLFDREDIKLQISTSNNDLIFPVFSEKIFVAIKRCIDRRKFMNK